MVLFFRLCVDYRSVDAFIAIVEFFSGEAPKRPEKKQLIDIYWTPFP